MNPEPRTLNPEPSAARRPFALVAAALLLTAVTATAQETTPQALPVDGEPFAGKLVGVDDQWRLTFRDDGQTRQLPAEELVRWGTCVEPTEQPLLVLADGGLLVAEVLTIDAEKLTVESALFGRLTLPLETVAGVVFQLPPVAARRDRLLDRVGSAKGDADSVWLLNGDEISGLIEAVQQDTVRVQADIGPIAIEIARIAALVFNPDLKQQPEPTDLRAWLGTTDGSRLLATQLELDDKSLRLTTSAGLIWKTDPGELVWLQPSADRVVYLSDLEPTDYRHEPFLNLSWPYRTDRSVTGTHLRADGRIYFKGLGTHSAARLSYRLDESYERFEAELAIDDSTEGHGSVQYRILVDGTEKYASPIVRGNDPPLSVKVEMTGAKRLELIVDYAEQADQQDHANWLDARLIRAAEEP